VFLTIGLLALVASLLMGATPAAAVVYQWDAAPGTEGVQGGGGNWLGGNNWWLPDDGGTNVAWQSFGPSTNAEALFGGAVAGTVFIDNGSPAVHGMTFDTAGYEIGSVGDFKLALSSSGGNLPFIRTNQDATLQAALYGSSGFRKLGSGVLTLTGTNNGEFSGAIQIEEGALSISNIANIGAASSIVLLNGATLRTTDTVVMPTHTVTIGAAGGTLDTVGSLTLGTGGLIGSTTLTKTGAGALILTGNMSATFTGGLTVNAGVVDFDADDRLGASNVITLGGGGLRYSAATGLTFARTLNITAGAAEIGVAQTGGTLTFNAADLIKSTVATTITKSGPGTLNLNAANPNLNASWNVTGGELAVGSAIPTLNQAITTNSGTTISATGGNVTFSGNIAINGPSAFGLRDFAVPANGRTMTVSGNLVGSSSVTLTGPTGGTGTLILTGDNTGFSGGFIANARTILNPVGAKAINPGSNITLNTSTFKASTFSPTATVDGTQGFKATYYNDYDASLNTTNFHALDRLYLFNRMGPTRTEPNANQIVTNTTNYYPPSFLAGMGTSGQGIGVLWQGVLDIQTGGNYTFSQFADDRATLFIDGTQVINIGGAGTTPVTGSVNLAAGAHSIVVRFANSGTIGYHSLSYSGADTGGTLVGVGTGAVASKLTNGSLPTLTMGDLTIAGGTSTVDLIQPHTYANLNFTASSTLAATSTTIDTLTVTGNTVLSNNVNPTFAPTSGKIVLAGPITGAGTNDITMAGPYHMEVQGNNTYTGSFTVTSGELDLNTTAGTAVTGALTLNASNNLGGGRMANVKFLQNNQIADTSIVTVQNFSVLDLNGKTDTIANLKMQAQGLIMGAGTITVTDLGGANSLFESGAILSNLAGGGGLNKTTSGTLTLGGANTYTGATAINAGMLRLAGGTLGATGAGNETTIASGATLQLIGGAINSSENILSAAGTGATPYGLSSGAIWNVGGANSLGNVNLAGATSIQVSGGALTLGNITSSALANLTVQGAGELIVGNVPSLTGGTLTKNGGGTLTFNTPSMGAFPTVTHNAGSLGFMGTQSFGAISVPAGLGYKFYGDPGAGTTFTVPAGSALINGGAVDNNLLSRVTAGAGSFVITQDSATALNFSGKSVGLGAQGMVNYTGVITPNAAGYAFNGLPSGLGETIVPNRLSLTQALSGAYPVSIDNGRLDLTRLTNTQTGEITIAGGANVEVLNNQNLGDAANGITLTDGSTLTLISNGTNLSGSVFGMLGNPIMSARRVITVGVGGGTIDVSAIGANQSGYALTGDFSSNLAANPLKLAEGAPTSTKLTKTGVGILYLTNASDFAGIIEIAPNGGALDLRNNGALTNAAGIIVNTGGQLEIRTDSALGQARQVPQVNVGDRIGNSIPITLQGGRLMFDAKNQAFNVVGNAETVGTVTLGLGQSEIRAERSSGGGADLIVTNLVRQIGSTVRFTGENTLAATGDNTRIVLGQIGGVAPVDNQFIGGWALVNSTDFGVYKTQSVAGGVGGVVAYGATVAGLTIPGYSALTTTTVPSANGWMSGSIGSATADVTLGTPGAAQNFVVGALRLSGGATRQILFANTTSVDTLYVESGGILSDGNNNARNIGAATNAFTRGILTAGNVGATTPQELFLHNNSNTTTIHSQIIDNPAIPGTTTVALVKDLDGQVNLTGTNTYSGGTYVLRGTLEGTVASALGKGPVTVKNGRVNINAAGTIDVNAATGGFTAVDNGEILLNNGSAAFTTTWDRFVIPAGSAILGPNASNANQGLNSLTRVAGSPAAGGEIQLAPGAIVAHQHVPSTGEMGIGSNTIKNLGQASDLWFGLDNALSNPLATLVVGTGTPWMGVSTDRNGRSWQQGTILANSDFWLQGLMRDNGYATLSLGSANSPGTYAIVNQAGRAINAFVSGSVALNEETVPVLPSDLTFVVTNGAVLSPNYARSLGGNTDITQNAKIRVLAGGTLDSGNYVPVGAAGSQPQGVAYPVGSSPLNGLVTVEAGGRMLVNDASGIGTTSAGAWTIKTDGILEINSTQSALGSTGGTFNADQFVFESGSIVRLREDIRIYRLDLFNQGTGAQGAIFEAAQNDKSLTDALDPRLNAAIGSTQWVQQHLTFSGGGGLTNDANDRTIRTRRGTVYLGDGAMLAATTQTYLYMNQNVSLLPNATVTIGSNRYIDGLPKLGTVRFNRENNNTGDNTTWFSLTDGTQLLIDTINVIPDSTSIHLPTPATTYGFPASTPGTALALNSNGNTEFIGKLTGAGTVFSNQDTTALGVGWNADSDFTFDGVISDLGKADNANKNDPQLVKVGPTKMTMTNTSNSAGNLYVYRGELSFAGANGKWTGGSMRVGKSATLTFDNTVTAVTNRFLSGGGLMTLGGGFQVLGHATDVGDVTIPNLYNTTGTGIPSYAGGSPGGFGTITVVPSGDLSMRRTSVTFNAFENFQSAGERNSVWLVRGVGVDGLPGSYDANGVYTANAANPKDGLVFFNSPRFTGNGVHDFNLGATYVIGGPGSPVVPVRGDLLASSDPNATSGEFATIDVVSGANRTGVRPLTASEYSDNGVTAATNRTVSLNVRAPAGAALNFNGDSRFQVLKMENGSSLNVSGTLPSLTQASQVVLNGGGILVPTGATAAITTDATGLVRTAGGVSAYLHTYGDLNVNGEFFSDQGLVKTGVGTASFTAGSLSNLRGRFVVHEGTVSINDVLSNIRGNATSEQAFNGIHVAINGGMLDINGTNQMFGRFESGNILAGSATEGGTLHSTAAATVGVMQGGTFSGHITGAVSLRKFGNNTLLLTNSNSTTGTVCVDQGTLTLRDSGTLPNITQFDINYARLDIDNGWLAGVPTRISPTANLKMRGGDFIVRGRAGEFITTNVGTVTIEAGTNLFQSIAGGGGANETIIGNLVRTAPGSMVAFQQNSSSFMGSEGNDTTASRYILTSLNGAPVSLTNNIIGGWAIANGDHFATYDPTRGVGALSSTEDGFANYDSGDLTTALATHNVNDSNSRTITVSKTINSLRHRADGGARTITLNSGVTLTVASGGILTNNNNQPTTFAGTAAAITSGASELYLWSQNNTTTYDTKLTGAIGVAVAGSGTTKFQGPGNDYTGTTYALGGSGGTSGRSGTLQLDVTGANGTTKVAVPGDLWIGNMLVSELRANQISQNATITLEGGGGLDLVNAASTTETFKAFVFLNAGGDANPRAIVSRSAQQITSTVRLTGATPITATNDNPVSTPAFSQNLGLVAFAGADGTPQTLMITSPVSPYGLSAAGFIFNAGIGAVPANVDDGGLVKDGTGLLIIGGNVASTFGSPATPTEVFNVKQGYVRVDSNDALGPNNAITTVQDGAVLLFNGNTVNGSLQLKDGSTIGVTMNNTTLGAIGSSGTVDVPAGATIEAQTRDYFIPASNTANITINHRLTGAGTINLVGIDYATGYNGGGVLQLRNTGNDFTGTINVGTNSVLEAISNSGTGNTLGTAAINLTGGVLRVRDQGDNAAGAQTITYGNNVTLLANSYINLDRQGAAATNKTIAFGSLTVPTGSKSLFVNNGNGFRASFSELAGPGTLVVSGNSALDIGALSTTNVPSIAIAGPNGASLQRSGLNFSLAAGAHGMANLTVNGIHTIASGRTYSVASTLEVGNNAGAVNNGLGFNGTSYVPVSNGAITGALLVDSGATLTTATLRNEGVIGPTGGAAAITATTIVGSGVFNAYGNDLTLNGTIADDGATPTTLRVAGTSAVVLPTVGHTFTGGVRVESGALRVAPTTSATNPLPTSGVIQTYGQPVSTVGAGTQAVNQDLGTLEFAAGANTITQGGTIVNNGAVRVSSGTVNLPGGIAGTTYASLTNLADFQAATVPGLLEGRFTTTANQPDTNSSARLFTADRSGNNGIFGVTLEPRMGQQNVVTQNALTGWTDNTTWIYTGYFYDADGLFTFAENIDDSVLMSIDGVNRILNNSGTNPYQTVTSTASNAGQRGLTADTGAVNSAATVDLITSATPLAPNPNLPAGWHTIEIRLDNGTGGGGPSTANGFASNFGVGFSPNVVSTLDGTQFFRPIDDGSGNLFRTAVHGKGNVQVDAGATLNTPQVTLTNRMTLAAHVGGGTINLNAGSAAASAVDNLQVTGTAGTATLTTNANTSLTVGNFSGAAGTTLTHDGSASRLVITGDATGGTINSTGAAGVTFDSNAAQSSTAVIAGNGGLVKQGSGALTLAAPNTYSGTTLISDGTVRLLNLGGLGTGASIWLDASDLTTITADGFGKVSQWNDKSGNDRNAVQLTGANQPTSATNALVGGKSVIQMDGTATFMNVDLASLANSSYTIIALEGRNSSKGDNYLLGTGAGSANTSLHFGYRDNTNVTLAQYGNDLNGTVAGYSSQQFSILVGTLDTASGHALYRDGVLLNSNANTTPLSSALGGTVGRGFASTTPRFYAGDLGEVLVFPYALSAAEVKSMTDLLTLKWQGAGSGSEGYIPNASPVSIAANATFDLNDTSETIGSLQSTSAMAAVILGSGTLTTGGNGDTTSFAGSITGTGNLVKDGAGTMTIAGADGNNYTGNTTVLEGILQVNYGVDSNGTGAGTTTVGTATSSATLVTQYIYQDTLIINAGSVVELMPSASAMSFVEVTAAEIGGGLSSGSVGASVAVTPVPEPATWLLVVMAALAGLVAWRRRR
jgi:autotransporter-associated beta strand protein